MGTGPALLENIVPTSLCRSSLTDSQECVTRYSRHLSTPSARLSFPIKGIAQMLGLLEYVASTTNHDHK
jgi:hypothetical protein